MKKKSDDGHRQGKFCGYTLLPDGGIVIAPMYASEFELITDERASINNLLSAMTESCHTILKSISARNRNLWKRVIDDYGLDENKTYTVKNGIIRESAGQDAGEGAEEGKAP